jgi:hypothetical protein
VLTCVLTLPTYPLLLAGMGSARRSAAGLQVAVLRRPWRPRDLHDVSDVADVTWLVEQGPTSQSGQQNPTEDGAYKCAKLH